MAFKLVAIVNDSLSLGSILMTKGVTVISIDTYIGEAVSKESAKILSSTKKRIKRFSHPEGKTGSDLIMEYMLVSQKAQWGELKSFLVKQGFSESSVNNAIQRLVNDSNITRVKSGTYVLNLEKALELNHQK